jgi:hypothetical protein
MLLTLPCEYALQEAKRILTDPPSWNGYAKSKNPQKIQSSDLNYQQ